MTNLQDDADRKFYNPPKGHIYEVYYITDRFETGLLVSSGQCIL